MWLTLAVWIVATWAVGWAVWPLSRRLFGSLPDDGLAAGRVLALVLGGIVCFWGASLHVLPLSLAPWLLPLILIALAVVGWRGTRARPSGAWRWSDGVFVASWLFFVWLRMRHPDINEFEKPMDQALLSTLWRASWLPPENPWMAGVPFTNYYYFGHFLAALLARTLHTSPNIAYNLTQPLFCALFVSTLWSLCAALTGSAWRGVVAASMVALLGHFEPLRQWSATGKLWPLSFWNTSRVIPGTLPGGSQIASDPNGQPIFTINEYPAFTLGLGDAHGHFWALAIAACLLCLCRALWFQAEGTPRRATLLCCGALLGALWMTNTWDVPLYALLILGCGVWSAISICRLSDTNQPHLETAKPHSDRGFSHSEGGGLPSTGKHSASKWKVSPLEAETLPSEGSSPPSEAKELSSEAKRPALWLELLWAIAPIFVARLVAAPYLARFQAQITGAVVDFWIPQTSGFLLFWGGWLLLLGITLVWIRSLPRDTLDAREGRFGLIVLIVGLIALIAPFGFYVRGIFGDGELRHQDTIFKFGLQAWLMLGTLAACGILSWLGSLPKPQKWAATAVLATLWSVPVLCAASIASWRMAPSGEGLSLDAGRFLPPDDREGVAWLRDHAGPDARVIEASGPGSYSDFGRVATLSGVPMPICWPQHLRGWGAHEDELTRRSELVAKVYAWPGLEAVRPSLQALGARYLFVGDLERRTYDGAALSRLRRDLESAIVWQRGESFLIDLSKVSK